MMVASMNPEIKTRWLKALRSGNYKQGSTYLKKSNILTNQIEHCCLGVLCEVVKEELGLVESFTGLDSGGIHLFNKSGSWLPSSVIDYTGLLSENVLASKNDDGYSFEVIANYIEQYL